MLSHYWTKSRLITNLIAGRLENGLCGKVVYRQRPNDLSLIWQVYSKSKQFWCFTHESLWYRVDISMFLVHLDRPLQCKQCWYLTISTPCASPAGIHQNRWKVISTGDVREWRKTELYRFGVTWNNDVGSIPSTKMHVPVYIKYICLLSVTKGGRGRNDITIQSAIQLVVIKIIMHQNIIWMYGSKMYVLY